MAPPNPIKIDSDPNRRALKFVARPVLGCDRTPCSLAAGAVAGGVGVGAAVAWKRVVLLASGCVPARRDWLVAVGVLEVRASLSRLCMVAESLVKGPDGVPVSGADGEIAAGARSGVSVAVSVTSGDDGDDAVVTTRSITVAVAAIEVAVGCASSVWVGRTILVFVGCGTDA